MASGGENRPCCDDATTVLGGTPEVYFLVGEIGSYDRGMAHRYPHLLKVNISSISMQSTIAVR